MLHHIAPSFFHDCLSILSPTTHSFAAPTSRLTSDLHCLTIESLYRMERTREAAGAGVVKVNDNKPPPSKRPVSAANIFKQRPKFGKKSLATPVLHVSTMKRPTRSKLGSSSSPGKVGENSSKKQDESHPLAAAFNGNANPRLPCVIILGPLFVCIAYHEGTSCIKNIHFEIPAVSARS